MGAIDEVASHRVGNTEYKSRLCELDSIDVRDEGGDCTFVLRRTQAAGDDPRFAVHGVHRHLCALRLSRRMRNLLCDVQVRGNRNRRILRLFIYSCAGFMVSGSVEGVYCAQVSNHRLKVRLACAEWKRVPGRFNAGAQSGSVEQGIARAKGNLVSAEYAE